GRIADHVSARGISTQPDERQPAAAGAAWRDAGLPAIQFPPGAGVYGEQRRAVSWLYGWRAEHHRRREDGDRSAGDGPAAARRGVANPAAPALGRGSRVGRSRARALSLAG